MPQPGTVKLPGVPGLTPEVINPPSAFQPSYSQIPMPWARPPSQPTFLAPAAQPNFPPSAVQPFPPSPSARPNFPPSAVQPFPPSPSARPTFLAPTAQPNFPPSAVQPFPPSPATRPSLPTSQLSSSMPIPLPGPPVVTSPKPSTGVLTLVPTPEGAPVVPVVPVVPVASVVPLATLQSMAMIPVVIPQAKPQTVGIPELKVPMNMEEPGLSRVPTLEDLQ